MAVALQGASIADNAASWQAVLCSALAPIKLSKAIITIAIQRKVLIGPRALIALAEQIEAEDATQPQVIRRGL